MRADFSDLGMYFDEHGELQTGPLVASIDRVRAALIELNAALEAAPKVLRDAVKVHIELDTMKPPSARQTVRPFPEPTER